jgi:hypothetical protein
VIDNQVTIFDESDTWLGEAGVVPLFARMVNFQRFGGRTPRRPLGSAEKFGVGKFPVR